jgi:hypothetical protein
MKSVVIDQADVLADIVPFAQHEIADRFLYGIDSEFEEEIPEYLESAVRKVGQAIISESASRSRAKKADLNQKLEQAISVTVKDFRDSVVKSIKEVFKRQIHGMVAFMPKQELANFAESMVNITSVKRKVSAEQESVGGPVDVAVISRSDGFVWVHRKHYFDAELNPRYFQRKFAEVPQHRSRV